ncbi:S1C family serine protease [Kutzneria kofuensis]|uniref:S1-C subfamily serine protease n=1 Tax=Kutzneria kofuensis TaxID=103725 RepID=A0A7W9NH15_9PSEU|nr:trypsin-like peptidase domain-containing protein [Kutzneria kofuensis]MBB5891653.1 S1-C subfamily serine protease [Kutzneria kofuensis]
MNEQQPSPEQPPATPVSGVDDGQGRRIGPRPLDRPAVDPSLAAEFGRPQGVDSAFAPRATTPATNGSIALAPPPPEALSMAFGRPDSAGDVVLQRAPGSLPYGSEPAVEPVFWQDSADRDPWRDPGAGAILGPPAGESEKDGDDEGKPAGSPGPLLSVPELLFGRRVKPVALATLAGVALLIGVGGGVAGWAIAQSGNPLTSSVTLSQVEPGKEQVPGSVADIVKRAQAAVVQIEVQVGNGGGLGSGVMIDSGGYILTNNHVVSAAASDPSATLRVVFADGTKTDAKIVGRDPKTDLAVIKVSVTNPTVIQLGKSSSLSVGDQVIAIGSPLGLSSSVTSGIVSAVNRPLQAAGEGGDPPVTYDAIQTDAAINHGNSGGALLDSTGALVGINSAILSPSDTGSIGIGFAIPIDFARRIAEGLIRDGQVKHADIGLNARSVSAVSTDGAQVQNVKQGGAAAKAGIAEGDVITKFAGRPIRTADELNVAIIERAIGETVPVEIVRQGRQMVLQVTTQSD